MRLTVIGGGHVGGVLGRLLAARAGFTVTDVLARSASSAQTAAGFIGAGRALDDYGALAAADIYMLSVTDDQIAPACEALAAAVPMRGAVVFHCSGALASDRLQAARDAGAYVASVHPIRSFADMEAVAAAFDGTFCGVEGDAPALAVLLPALAAIGARAVQIDASAKTVYHAAAVFASNYLVTVLDAALRAYQAAGIPEDVARELTRPLASESMQNVFRLGAAPALSGPIARGDMATVKRQQDAVSAWDAATGQLYEALVPPTVALAARKRAGRP
jgi:predicted short-subunit dehydrogenase-like oxidoreductase (DUF2520 family)